MRKSYRRRNDAVALLGASLLLLLLASCSKNTGRSSGASTTPGGQNHEAGNAQAVPARNAQPPLPTGASGYAHVTYRANVRVMEAAEGRQALIGVSSNDASLLFDSSNQTARSLRAGDVLLIKGLLARNVVAAETTPDGVVVLTQQAALTDVIQDGDIHLQSPVRFGVAAASSPHPPTREPFSWGSLFVENAYAQSPESNAMSNAEAKGTRDAYGNMIKGAFKSVVEGWETTFKATPGEGKTDLNITLKKNVGGFEALITGQGYISNFGFDSDIAIRQGTIQNMDSSFKNLNGQMNMQWVVAKDSAGIMAEESRIKLPGAIEVPLAEFLEGLPLYLEVSGALLIHPAVTGGKEYSKGQFRISYDGYQHFKVKPGNIDTNGNVTGDIDLGEHQDLSPVAPLGMVVAFCAPRIELMLGLNKIYEESDIKKAAEIVDQIADQVAKRLLSPDKYADYQKNGIHLGQTFKNALSTSGAVYFQTVATSASSFSGNGSISPCSRYDLTFVAQVGASAQAWGQSVGTVSKEIFKKQVTKVDPPGMRLCENIGKS